MEVLSTKPLTDKAATKLLKKFVDSKQEAESADLMMNEEVKAQLAQVLEFLQTKQTRASSQ